MQKILQFILLANGMLLSFNAIAETVLLPRSANVRLSKIFYGRDNVIGQLPQGAQVEIVALRKLPSGANSLEIKIITPENKLSLNERKPIYIWQSKDEIKNDLFKMEAGTVCTNCNSNAAKAPTSTQDIQTIANEIEKQQSSEQTNPEEPIRESQATESLADAIKKYSESTQVQKSFNWAKSHIRRGNGMCYLHTKEALATQTKGGQGPGNNLIPKWYASSKAKYGVTDLKKKGFVNLLEHDDYKDMTSHTAPHGAVLIYKHVNKKGLEDKKAGHAEIKFNTKNPVDGKTTSHFYYGPMRNYPVNSREGSRYILIGIMIKSPTYEEIKQ